MRSLCKHQTLFDLFVVHLSDRRTINLLNTVDSWVLCVFVFHLISSGLDWFPKTTSNKSQAVYICWVPEIKTLYHSLYLLLIHSVNHKVWINAACACECFVQNSDRSKLNRFDTWTISILHLLKSIQVNFICTGWNKPTFICAWRIKTYILRIKSECYKDVPYILM